ncbi:glycosyltransferase family 2 protein [Halotalea alkalilenta]|uniref:glycosyltransferase family 2 protein n=1 Tax=Halotalea alkalilenta TaxID=376489 RepID=UPI00047FD565|nr:glycosyltransferase [Halotalea alkalilenta]
MDLSIVILSWNELGVLDRCLSSFYDRFDFSTGEIILIDNGSTDGTLVHVNQRYPKVITYRFEHNMGVSVSRNKAVELSSGRFIMTLDNDTIIDDCHFVEAIDNHYKRYPETGVLGFKLLNSDGSFQQSFRRFPGWIQPFAARVEVLQKIPFFANVQNRHMMSDLDPASLEFPLVVDYMLGANQIYRRALFDKLEGYDSKIFYGPEDFDFCMRAGRLGLVNYVSDALSITHAYQRKTKKKFSRMTLKHFYYYYYVMMKNGVRHG